jgi:hypothetical protein
MKFKEWYFHIAVIAFCGSFLTSFAFADSLNVATGYQENGNGNTSRPSTFKYIHDVNKNVDIDILFQDSKTVDQYELGARYKFSNRLYTRALLGSLNSSKDYIGAEIGLMVKPIDRVGFRIDHAIITGLNTNNMDLGFSRAWISYDLTSATSIGVRRDWMRGDLDFDAWRLLLQYRF